MGDNRSIFQVFGEHTVQIRPGYCALLVQYYSIIPKAGYCILLSSVNIRGWEKELLYVQPMIIAYEYKGTLKVVVHNMSNETVTLYRGTHIANLCILPITDLLDQSQTSFPVKCNNADNAIAQPPNKKSKSCLDNIFGVSNV